MNEFLQEKYNDLLNEEAIDCNLYDKYDVKRGLRNNNGTGVLVGLTRVAEVSGYVVENGIVEQYGVLIDYSHQRPQLLHVQVADVRTVNEYPAFVRVVESWNQVSQCGFPGSGFPYDCQEPAFGYLNADAVEYLP